MAVLWILLHVFFLTPVLPQSMLCMPNNLISSKTAILYISYCMFILTVVYVFPQQFISTLGGNATFICLSHLHYQGIQGQRWTVEMETGNGHQLQMHETLTSPIAVIYSDH